MIVSENSKPEIGEFRKLMLETDKLLNMDAKRRPAYYAGRGGSLLEDDVLSALEECATGTSFANTIIKVSGQHFPDIVAAKYYGVEVKSTKGDHWTSTGSSILETTRVVGVERIFMTFGKLGGKPHFLSKPYEECLSGIAVTHMPRYLIDMRLDREETIFAKLGIPYDELRQMENPIEPVSVYYRSKLKPGERLWWTGNKADESVAPTIRLWKKLSREEKRRCTVFGCIHYPEVFAGDYDGYSLWLASQGIVDPHIRDQFSAGGKEKMLLSNGEQVMLPAVYRRVKKNKELFRRMLTLKDCILLDDLSNVSKCSPEQIEEWCRLVSVLSVVDYDISLDALKTLFEI